MLKVKALRKIFPIKQGMVRAVDDVGFEVGKGEFFTLLGPSGSGKSTVLRCIAGLETPENGEIVIGEKVVFSSRAHKSTPPNERDISMVFQSYAIWPHMTVHGNVVYPLLGKMSKKMTQAKVMESLKLVGLQELLNRPASLLSGGQQQRVALARAIAKESNLLLLDEPLSNLDARLRQIMRQDLRALQKRLGITAIYVTHDQEEALSMSDRVAVLNEGKIIEIGTPLRIYQQPKTKFAASFIGLCNFIPGKLNGINYRGQATVKTTIGEIECLVSEIKIENVYVSIRPEYITVSKQPFTKDRNVFEGVVVSQFFLGRIFDCFVKVGGYKIRVEILSSKNIKKGEKIFLYLDPRFCVVIPKQ